MCLSMNKTLQNYKKNVKSANLIYIKYGVGTIT